MNPITPTLESYAAELAGLIKPMGANYYN